MTNSHLVRAEQPQQVKSVKVDYTKPWWSGSRLMAMCSRIFGGPCVVGLVESNGWEIYAYKLEPTSGFSGDEQIASPSQCQAGTHYSWEPVTSRVCYFVDMKGTQWEVREDL